MDISGFIKLAELFKNFSDPSRLMIMQELLQGPLHVGELADRLGMTQSAISHQLRILRNVRLVKFIKEGKSSLYSLDDDHVSEILKIGAEHVNHN